MRAESSESTAPAIHRLAVLGACAALALIFIGGLVTTTHTALAVPDWPLAFGQLVPRRLTHSAHFSYDHRIAAAMMVIIALTVAVYTFRHERRRWVRNTALAAVGVVMLQALIGGMLVLFRVPLPVAVAHTAGAQIFFCLMVALAIFTSPWFFAVEPRTEAAEGVRFTTLCAVTTVVIDLDLFVCAVMKHAGAGGAIPDYPTVFGGLTPPVWNMDIALNFGHRVGALVVTVFVLWTLVRALKEHRDENALRRPAEGLALLLLGQIVLGGITVLSGRALLLSTMHDVLAAAVLATSVMLTIRAWRVYRAPAVVQERAAWRSASEGAKMAKRVSA